MSLTLDNIKSAIKYNEPIDNILHCVTMISNPCEWNTRYKLTSEFIERMKEEPNIILYVVEIAYKEQDFKVTEPDNPQHLQLRVDNIPMWHKENAINAGIEKLLPKDWKAVAWIDADIYFEDPNWSINALKILADAEIIQLFSIALDLDKKENAMCIYQSFCHQYVSGRRNLGTNGFDYWHPGYAWACTRNFYEKMGGLYELSILGTGDYNMARCLVGSGQKSLHEDVSEGYRYSIKELEDKIKGSIIGFVPCSIRHYYHGTKKNRKYTERWDCIVKSKFNPIKHLEKNKDGILIPNKQFPPRLKYDIMVYFFDREEDDYEDDSNGEEYENV